MALIPKPLHLVALTWPPLQHLLATVFISFVFVLLLCVWPLPWEGPPRFLLQPSSWSVQPPISSSTSFSSIFTFVFSTSWRMPRLLQMIPHPLRSHCPTTLFLVSPAFALQLLWWPVETIPQGSPIVLLWSLHPLPHRRLTSVPIFSLLLPSPPLFQLSQLFEFKFFALLDRCPLASWSHHLQNWPRRFLPPQI